MDYQPTYKEALTLGIASATNMKNDTVDLTDNSLIIVTAAGIITGTYVSKDMENSLNNDAAYVIFKTNDANAKKLSGCPSSAILLKDAVISTSGFHHSFKYLHVFIDEIIALSFGNISYN